MAINIAIHLLVYHVIIFNITSIVMNCDRLDRNNTDHMPSVLFFTHAKEAF